MRSIAHVRIYGGRGQATALGYPPGRGVFHIKVFRLPPGWLFHDRKHQGAFQRFSAGDVHTCNWVRRPKKRGQQFRIYQA